MPEDLKPLKAPLILEKTFLVAGKRVKVQVVFPSNVGELIGLENVYIAAQHLVIRAESPNATVKELKLGE